MYKRWSITQTPFTYLLRESSVKWEKVLINSCQLLKRNPKDFLYSSILLDLEDRSRIFYLKNYNWKTRRFRTGWTLMGLEKETGDRPVSRMSPSSLFITTYFSYYKLNESCRMWIKEQWTWWQERGREEYLGDRRGMYNRSVYVLIHRKYVSDFGLSEVPLHLGVSFLEGS